MIKVETEYVEMMIHILYEYSTIIRFVEIKH